MAGASSASTTDKDLASIAEARALARRAKDAQAILGEFSQAQVDAVIDAMAAAVTPQAESLARLAVEETGFGVVADKVQKNLFSSQRVYEFIKPMKTVGVINRFEDRKVIEIAEPFGVVAAVIPSTNPTSTAIYKILIAIKARCAVVITPHPSAARCITCAADIMNEAGRRAGLPDGAIGWMKTVTLEGTQELMKAREVSVILATGGMGLVRAAYSAGKPAYGVGPGNAPCYIESSADVRKAANDILTGKAFDNGVLCSSPNSVVVDQAIEAETKRQFIEQGGYFLSAAAADMLAKQLVTPQRLPNPAFVGKPATFIAQQIGITVPPNTRALIAELKGVGRDHPLSIEKLCPVLSYYVVKDWRDGCERCKEILRYGGMGHTMSIHSQNDAVILEFGLHKPAYRICVNTPTTHGSIGLTTGLDPAMTLGCGGFGGNITSDNITPKHLLNIKRVAYELKSAVPTFQGSTVPKQSSASSVTLPKVREKSAPDAISSASLTNRIDRFLATRGLAPAKPGERHETALAGDAASSAKPTQPEVFVCEADVQNAVKTGQKLLIGERTIVTPAARDAGETAKVFVHIGGTT
jgi:acetaldehyde dehydrogenase (acetylating)